MVGDGYPGIVPAWVQTLWLLGESIRRSLTEGEWFSETSVYMLFHVWSRTENLSLQRLPIALFNGLLVLLIAIWVARLYDRRAGVLTLVLVALDPFLLADSRVNRAEAIFTGLFTLSILSLVLFGCTRQLRWLVISGFLGGLADQDSGTGDVAGGRAAPGAPGAPLSTRARTPDWASFRVRWALSGYMATDSHHNLVRRLAGYVGASI
ncbi:MAG: glycosyltransferase family 39 protein [Anaerolineae bacterium]|nr:glycosyltransferase family 39 protein [Anaerolineae bacterium]MDW8071075.1 glycosyltransferase family 39 protein [Anaerolineae bacterium]